MPVVSSRCAYCASVRVYRPEGRKLVRVLLASRFYGTIGQGRPVILKDLFIGAVLVGGTFAGVVAAASAIQDGDDNTATFQQVSNRASLGHVLIDNIGQGRAQLFMDGTETEAIWRKAENASRTRFYSQTGLEIGFRPGQTWIEVVDPSGGVRID